MIDKQYFLIPINLMRDFVTKKNKTINDMFAYGIYVYTKDIKINMYEISVAITKSFYDNKLPEKLLGKINKYIDDGKLMLDKDNEGYCNGIHKYEVEQLNDIYQTDYEFKFMAIEFYKIWHVLPFLGDKIDYENCIEDGRQIYNKSTNDAMANVTKKKLFEFRDNDKTELELMIYAANLSIRSILGKTKHFDRMIINNILCRVFGYKSFELMTEYPELFVKYHKEHNFKKIKLKLVDKWGIIFRSEHMHGWDVGLKSRTTKKAMIKSREKEKDSYKEMVLRLEEKELLKEVRKEIELENEQRKAAIYN